MPYIDRTNEKSIVKGMLLSHNKPYGALIIYVDPDKAGETIQLVRNYINSEGNTEIVMGRLYEEKVAQYTIRGKPCYAVVFKGLSGSLPGATKDTYNIRNTFYYHIGGPKWAEGIDISILGGELTEEDWRFETASDTIEGKYRVVEDRLVPRSQSGTDLTTIPQPAYGQLPPDRRLRP